MTALLEREFAVLVMSVILALCVNKVVVVYMARAIRDHKEMGHAFFVKETGMVQIVIIVKMDFLVQIVNMNVIVKMALVILGFLGMVHV